MDLATKRSMPSFFRYMRKTDVLHAQASGCWLYVQTPGGTGYFFGHRIRRGLRIVWREGAWIPRLSTVRHTGIGR